METSIEAGVPSEEVEKSPAAAATNAQEKSDANSSDKAQNTMGAPGDSAKSGDCKDKNKGGIYAQPEHVVGDHVEYWSNTNKHWIDAIVQKINLGAQGNLVSYDLGNHRSNRTLKREAQANDIRQKKLFSLAHAKNIKVVLSSGERFDMPSVAASCSGAQVMDMVASKLGDSVRLSKLLAGEREFGERDTVGELGLANDPVLTAVLTQKYLSFKAVGPDMIVTNVSEQTVVLLEVNSMFESDPLTITPGHSVTLKVIEDCKGREALAGPNFWTNVLFAPALRDWVFNVKLVDSSTTDGHPRPPEDSSSDDESMEAACRMMVDAALGVEVSETTTSDGKELAGQSDSSDEIIEQWRVSVAARAQPDSDDSDGSGDDSDGSNLTGKGWRHGRPLTLSAIDVTRPVPHVPNQTGIYMGGGTINILC